MAEGGDPSLSQIEPRDVTIDETASIVTTAEEDYAKRGLGYVIDATNENPWKNKTSISVRDMNDIKVVREARAFQSYSREIASASDISLNANTTLGAFDSAVTVGVDVDIARSSEYRRHTVGTKVHTKTASFEIKFGDKSQTKFEQMLCQQINFDGERDELELLNKKCKHFVKANQCTHYVRRIMLGYCEYTVMSSEMYNQKYGAKGEVAVKGLQYGSLSAGVAGHNIFQRKDKRHQYLSIGKWSEKKKEVEEEEVIEYEIAPIHTLVSHHPKLHDALMNAVKEYIKDRLQEHRKLALHAYS